MHERSVTSAGDELVVVDRLVGGSWTSAISRMITAPGVACSVLGDGVLSVGGATVRVSGGSTRLEEVDVASDFGSVTTTTAIDISLSPAEPEVQVSFSWSAK